MANAKLILVRHGKSEWNKSGRWCGLTDVGLVEEGIVEAEKAGEALRGFEVHVAHVSALKRTHQTFEAMKRVSGHSELVASAHAALNERHYGIHTGKNKWQVKEEIGEAAFVHMRRSWNAPIPGGETLKDVHDRVVPHYEAAIKPHLQAGKTVLVVAHGNSLRALVKYLENIADEDVEELEIGTGEVYCYDIDENGAIIGKEIRSANHEKLMV